MVNRDWRFGTSGSERSGLMRETKVQVLSRHLQGIPHPKSPWLTAPGDPQDVRVSPDPALPPPHDSSSSSFNFSRISAAFFAPSLLASSTAAPPPPQPAFSPNDRSSTYLHLPPYPHAHPTTCHPSFVLKYSAGSSQLFARASISFSFVICAFAPLLSAPLLISAKSALSTCNLSWLFWYCSRQGWRRPPTRPKVTWRHAHATP